MQDAVIIGGSFAGLTAALQLGRASRSVTVIDAGAPRNQSSSAAHGVAGWDGLSPSAILERFRADLRAYPSVTQRSGTVTAIHGGDGAFSVTLADGEKSAAKRIILAHGVRDILPDIPGLAQAWGQTVLHCPYCHGYEVKGAALAVLATHPMSAHQALMLRADWSAQVTLITGGMAGLDLDALATAGVQIETRALETATADDTGIDLSLSGGATARFAALFVGPRTSLAASPAEQLGCALADGPMGPFVKVGAMAQTSVPGVFAAGDLARPMPNINFALADGAQAGTGCHASLLFPGFVTPLEVTS
ncbi:MAG: NAD(P)/FAD-dependent oxidoreductase [Alphaproteobacteria bacterium]|nr:NAD(P)/FAD-dependent oxidoreductase [Alphaproteobacteria bacterium]MBU1277951.1 NAD(P)/FAD-dependent oxidoreductase [Alphaproteobacteria bacterium]MBU1573708.1 NAD(P)/FAD-dependent oxidoreductase [Alphaproteobacteria bacterium]MBU1828175.1 NAD(P)/FAD-dependent oxidoreductase [Alphaproteobacteria bacterium]MBU2079161.1 NAD(P)/FAD-dependent oxidoreductase [Alphaproteobacteria bacterium]